MNTDDPSTGHSITKNLELLKSPDAKQRDEAAEQIWRRYVPKLLELARRHLNGRVRRREDENDVVQEMYECFCQRQQRGELAVGDRNELWQVLMRITLCKVRNAVERQGRQRRDYRRESAQSADGGDGSPPDWLPNEIASREPTPAEAAALNEEFHNRLASLSPTLRRIALWKLEGYTHEEIAAKLGCSKRNVIRKLNLIRDFWQASAERA